MPEAESRTRQQRVYFWIVVSLAILYVIQAWSPIRLDNDSVVHLRAGSRLADGLTADFPNSPLGYPKFLAILDRLGLGSYAAFVLANCVFVGISIVCTHYLIRDRLPAGRYGWFVPLTLLTFPVIRYMPMVLPEVMFMAVALLAVVAMTAATTREAVMARIGFILTALALTVVAISLRIMGFVLVPPLLATCFIAIGSGRTGQVVTKVSGRQVAIAAVTLIVLALVAFSFADSLQRYAAETALKYSNANPLLLLRGRALSIFWSAGALAVNLPPSRFWSFQTWFIVAGFFALLLALAIFRFRWARTPAGIYLASSIALLILWPYNTLRLWLPIMPLLIAYIETAELRFTPGRKWRAFTLAYIAAYAAAGLASLAYTTRITFSGKDFPKVYGRNGGMAIPDSATGRIDSLHNARAKVLMERYGRPF